MPALTRTHQVAALTRTDLLLTTIMIELFA